MFGIYFALKLADAGLGPVSVGQGPGRERRGLRAEHRAGVRDLRALFPSPVAQLGVFVLTSWLAILVARTGWPALWKVLLAYAFAARLPVLVIMFLSIFGGWDTHYTKPRPDFPAMGPWGIFFWTALLPQLSVWIYLTVVGGGLFGAFAVWIGRLIRQAVRDRGPSLGGRHERSTAGDDGRPGRGRRGARRRRRGAA